MKLPDAIDLPRAREISMRIDQAVIRPLHHERSPSSKPTSRARSVMFFMPP
jgi:hypothetical protein